MWLVAWGQLFRSDWGAVLVRAYDEEDALAIVAEAYPERWRPRHAFLATDVVASAVIAGEPPPPGLTLVE